ncbi:hypothetical protein EAO77_21325 [Streptomyces sp. t39]|nr:hypothetical protein EAO77_21325 [Streptomyces sp. t39]
MAVAATGLLARVQALVAEQGSGLPPADLSGGCHCAAAADVPQWAAQLVRSAVRADRRAGVSWAQIGGALGISGEAARARYGRTRASRRSVPPGGAARRIAPPAPSRVRAGS